MSKPRGNWEWERGNGNVSWKIVGLVGRNRIDGNVVTETRFFNYELRLIKTNSLTHRRFWWKRGKFLI